MNRLNKAMLMIALTIIGLMGAKAQDYTMDVSNPSSKTLHIKEVNKVSVEAYDGNQIQIESSSHGERPERAEGLKPLSARGEDNTNLGLHVSTDGDMITIFQTARREQGLFKIRVPKGMKVKIEHTGQWEGGKIEVYNVSTELEVSGRYNSVYLEDITGPALVNTVYGSVEAKFSALSQSGPTSLVSVYSTVDVTLPETSKANVTVRTPYGEAYSDLNIEFSKSDEMKKISSPVKGTLNGGGVDLELRASYGNVYLRKK
ncbi:hypothetical protein [Roseivirga sp.]|uniref:hypothetical protein n=1 Tax=Roseivirga sp. TaxID=1964215 RepID=UPI003B51738D